MLMFPKLNREPTTFSAGLIPFRRMSQSGRGGIVSEPTDNSKMLWGISFSYEQLGPDDTANLEAFLAKVQQEGGVFTLSNIIDTFGDILAAHPITAGKNSLTVQLEGEGYAVSHLPGGVASFTIDVTEQK